MKNPPPLFYHKKGAPMSFEIRYLSSRSITLEWQNESIYYTPKSYDVYLNDHRVLSNLKTNVFSVYDLNPSSFYEIRVDDYSISFKTACEKTINVKDLGAIGDGFSDDTDAFNQAINLSNKDTMIYVPKGTYLITPLFLKSYTSIYLSSEATLLGHTNRMLYPILPEAMSIDGQDLEISSWEGTPAKTHASLLTAINQSHLQILGNGTIDCQAELSDWWSQPKEMKNGSYRPKGLFFSFCKNIVIQGITLKNTPSWSIHPYFSDHLKFYDILVTNPKDSPNTDGLDPESCFDVEIIGARFSVGDDCIAIKSGKMAMGMKYKRSSSHILIRNCHMAFGHGAVVLGSEMSGGIQDLKVSQCFFESTDRGLRIKTRRGRGKYARIDGVTFENIHMNHVLTPLVMNMFYFCDPDGKTEYVYSKEQLPIDDRTPFLGKFHFKNIVCTDVEVAAGYFYGLPEMPIESIILENITFNYHLNPQMNVPAMMSFIQPMARTGLHFHHVKHVIIRSVTFNGVNEPKIIQSNVDLMEESHDIL
jgi:polygalacturonase